MLKKRETGKSPFSFIIFTAIYRQRQIYLLAVKDNVR